MTRRASILLALLALGCGPSAAIQEHAVSAVARQPVAVERVPLPAGSSATAVWMAKTGAGVIALRDGRFYAVDANGAVSAIEALDGGHLPAARLEPLGPSSALALMPNGALVVDRGFARRTKLPPLLAAPSAFASFGADALWATPAALYARLGDRWINVEDVAGPVQGVDEIVPFRGPGGTREAWVRAGARVTRVRVGPGERVAWLDAAPGLDLRAVTAITPMDDVRGAVLAGAAVTVVGPDGITTFRQGAQAGQPVAIGGGGGWAYVGWGGELLRTDGRRWESLARGMSFAPPGRIAVDGGTGASALVIDATGAVLHVETEAALDLTGLVDGQEVPDSRIELEAVPLRRGRMAKLDFVLDGKALSERKAAPWGLGPDGASSRDLDSIGFGAHTLDVVAHLESGADLRRRVLFTYVSPLARVPSFAADVAPLFAARCTPCHVNGGARNLATYEALRAQSSQLRASIREARMPPDLLLDQAGRAIFTAWVDGGSPP